MKIKKASQSTKPKKTVSQAAQMLRKENNAIVRFLDSEEEVNIRRVLQQRYPKLQPEFGSSYRDAEG
jgi:hypothetical protein